MYTVVPLSYSVSGSETDDGSRNVVRRDDVRRDTFSLKNKVKMGRVVPVKMLGRRKNVFLLVKIVKNQAVLQIMAV